MSGENLKGKPAAIVYGYNGDLKEEDLQQSLNTLQSSSADHLNSARETYTQLEDPHEEDSGDTSRYKNNIVEIQEKSGENEGRHCCERCRSATFKVYTSHFLSSWGDRMWMFAGGLFLLEVTPGSLRLAAVYGASLALTVIIFGAPVGHWVDRTSRLTSAQVSLSIQNIMVCLCAALLVVIITQHHIFNAWDGWLLVIAEEDTSKVEEFSEQSVYTRQANKSKKIHKILEYIVSAWGAWLKYMKHPVRDAGLSLALIYMTVLAFDNYSRAFVYDSGVPENILGALTAVASLVGILGSLATPYLRSKIGITKTGLVGFGCETLCLTLCVASVFAPGSPFDASALLRPAETSTNLTSSTLTTPPYFISNSTIPPSDFIDKIVSLNTTERITNDSVPEIPDKEFTFVILLLTGIISSRFGLWVVDLTVTQILQEGVEEDHRGAINGVQYSLNQSLNLLRAILIIILPKRETFGFLILLSFLFVSSAWVIFASYACRHPSSTPTTITPETEELKPATE
nr:solute carrier family 40 member 1-like isoform X5 [Cherax quadricarinatus]